MPTQAHAHFGGVVAAEDIPVLDKGHLAAETRCGYGGAEAGHTGAYDYKVVRAFVLGLLGKQLIAEMLVFFDAVPGNLVRKGKQNGIVYNSAEYASSPKTTVIPVCAPG